MRMNEEERYINIQREREMEREIQKNSWRNLVDKG